MTLADAVRLALADAGDPIKAPRMRAYMKSAMPFRGVQTPLRRRICRSLFATYPLGSFEEWRDTVLELWREASFREERYAAIELTGDRLYRRFQTLETVPMYEEMVVTGAWWDYVDEIAQNRIGPLLRSYPGTLGPLMLSWARSPDLWKRRTSIICQDRLKGDTDLDLLYSCIGPNLDDRDFFVRKAIGWALREYSKTDPAEVVRYVRDNEKRLSPLSRREALKRVSAA